MTTLNEIAYFIAGRYNRSHDDKFVREVAFAVKYWRAFLIRQDIEKNIASPLYKQKIIITTQVVDETDNCVIAGDCKVLRTTVPVPEPVRSKTHSSYGYVGTDDNKYPFGYIPYERVYVQRSSRITGKKPFYTLYNGYIYLYNTLKLDYVAVVAAFVDPVYAGKVCIESANCANDDAPFFTPADMLKTIVDGIISGAFSLTVHESKEVEVV